MLTTIMGALLPAVITVLLGYLAARHHDFAAKDAPILNRMVLTYALPLSIFVDTISRTHAELVEVLPLLVVLSIAVISLYGAVFLVWRYVFGFSPGMSALSALAASAPNGPYVGSVVLGYLYGTASGIPVAASGVLIYLTVAPVTVFLLSFDAGKRTLHPGPRLAHPSALIAPPIPPPGTYLLKKILDTLKQPVVWIPLFGTILVLMGISMPKLIANSLALLGHTAGGVALFSSGILLASYKVKVNSLVLSLVFLKNILQPALVWVSLLLLGYTNPLLGETVVMAALPMMVLVVILAVEYQVAETEAASGLFISMVASIVTLSAFIALTSR